MKTLILGLGNPILSDDGVGNRVAQELEGKLAHCQDVTAMETGMAGHCIAVAPRILFCFLFCGGFHLY
jgi:hydrogenase maturation protease